MIDEDLKKFIPTFLANNEQENLFYGLKQIRDNNLSRLKNFYIGNHPEESILEQGDGVDNLPIFNLPDTTTVQAKGFIISNTCDISPDNNRKIPMNTLYAPIVNLNKYEELLRKNGEYTDEWAQAVRNQQITNLFYLPKGIGLDYEAVVPLDHINSLPASYISDEDILSNRIFRLSLTAWYVLLIKLTHHFARTTNDLIVRKSISANS